jgi:hypothetical protein
LAQLRAICFGQVHSRVVTKRKDICAEHEGLGIEAQSTPTVCWAIHLNFHGLLAFV